MFENLPTIFLCIDCGSEIERAIKYQIRQDRCPYCFKKISEKKFQLAFQKYLNFLKLDQPCLL